MLYVNEGYTPVRKVKFRLEQTGKAATEAYEVENRETQELKCFHELLQKM